MNTAILRPEVQHYLREQSQKDPVRIALQKSPFIDIQTSELAQQVESRQRCRKKLPLWYNTPDIYYPPRTAIEQASSEMTARYKSHLISPEDRIIDVTGGFGVDAYYFAQQAAEVVYCEQNITLAHIVRHNLRVLGTTNMTVEATNGIAYLQHQPDVTFDCLYIDPSRRKNQQKIFLLSDCEPNVVVWLDLLLQKANKVLIKASPLLDISLAWKTLRHVSAVHIISVDNECKELLFVLNREFNGTPQLTAVALNGDQRQTFRFTPVEEKTATPVFGFPTHYLYEPDVALLKSGAFKCIGQRFGLHKLHAHTHLYTSEHLLPNFMGRVFNIDQVMSYTAFKKIKQGIQANISTRNFPLDTKALRKKHRLKDGGDTFLFFCTGMNQELLVIFASKN